MTLMLLRMLLLVISAGAAAVLASPSTAIVADTIAASPHPPSVFCPSSFYARTAAATAALTSRPEWQGPERSVR